MEFIVKQQAKFDAMLEASQAKFEARLAKSEARFEANFARSNRRLDRIEQVLTQTNRVVARLASAGVGLRSDIRQHAKRMAEHEAWLRRHDEKMSEMEEKLDALIDIVDKSIRRNGGTR